MKFKYVLPVLPILFLPLIWARWAGLSRSPLDALESASANSFFSEDYVNKMIIDHLRTKGLSPHSCGLQYSADDGVEEIDSTQDKKLFMEFEKEYHPPLNLLCMDCPKYFKIHSKFGFYWVSIEP